LATNICKFTELNGKLVQLKIINMADDDRFKPPYLRNGYLGDLEPGEPPSKDEPTNEHNAETHKSSDQDDIRKEKILYDKIAEDYESLEEKVAEQYPQLANIVNENRDKIDIAHREYTSEIDDLHAQYSNDPEALDNALKELDLAFNPLQPMMDDLDHLLPEDIRELWNLSGDEINDALLSQEYSNLNDEERNALINNLKSWKNLESQILNFVGVNKSNVEAKEIYQYFTFAHANMGDSEGEKYDLVIRLRNFIKDRESLIAYEKMGEENMSEEDLEEYWKMSISSKNAMLGEIDYYLESRNSDTQVDFEEAEETLDGLSREGSLAKLFGTGRNKKVVKSKGKLA
jgi:hypothetical protein